MITKKNAFTVQMVLYNIILASPAHIQHWLDFVLFVKTKKINSGAPAGTYCEANGINSDVGVCITKFHCDLIQDNNPELWTLENGKDISCTIELDEMVKVAEPGVDQRQNWGCCVRQKEPAPEEPE